MNPNTSIRLQVKYLAVHAGIIAALMVLSRADWIMSGLYHGDQSADGIATAVVALMAIVAAILIPLGMCMPTWLAEMALRAITVATAIYVFQPVVRALPIFPPELIAIHKIALTIITLALAWLAATKLSPPVWHRLQMALIVGALIFVTLPMITVLSTASIFVHPPPHSGAKTSTVVLLLDELNAEAAPQVAAAIKQAGGIARLELIRAVGASTITVIPEMLGGPHVPQARVCTPTAVCDQHGLFDFQRLNFDPSDKFHLVGFHHPYCAAHGYASCERFAPPNRPPVSSLLCSFGRLLPGINASDCDWFAADDWEVFRQRVRDAALGSPFWTEGGTLFAHVPFPHPPGNSRGAGLQADYAANLVLASRLAAEIWTKGQGHFGPHFRLIVISDHPLRPALWCKHSKYRVTGCEVANSAYPGMVPYIDAGTQLVGLTAPADNGHIFQFEPVRPMP